MNIEIVFNNFAVLKVGGYFWHGDYFQIVTVTSMFTILCRKERPTKPQQIKNSIDDKHNRMESTELQKGSESSTIKEIMGEQLHSNFAWRTEIHIEESGRYGGSIGLACLGVPSSTHCISPPS